MSMRHITRRDFLRSSAAAVAAMAVPGIGLAQEYPTKAIKIIVGFAPGGTTDSLPRILSNGMAAKLGQPVIVENKLGAAGNIATTFVAQSPPDGYTLLASSVGQIVVSPFTSEMAVDPMKDLVHITMFGEGDQYLTIPATSRRRIIRSSSPSSRRIPASIFTATPAQAATCTSISSTTSGSRDCKWKPYISRAAPRSCSISSATACK
jgi:tripartite-type tricarboxylate transporter receptor subunit TctC